MTVMRQSDVSRNDEDDLLSFSPEKSVKQRLQVIPHLLQCRLKCRKWCYNDEFVYSSPSGCVSVVSIIGRAFIL